MEYEIYKYCTGMGTLIILLIIFYHFLGDDKHGRQEQVQTSKTEAQWVIICSDINDQIYSPKYHWE
jgi:uncharacterized membrane protein YukC